MQTTLHPQFASLPEAAQAEAILRRCVHCGFCNATCPTYQELGDERDGPRGRIYLIKNLLEQGTAGAATQQHLDRCLTCRSCETTCPSGVQYAELADIGRHLIESRVPRPTRERLLRRALRVLVPWPRRLSILVALARGLRFALPGPLRAKLPPRQNAGAWPPVRHRRKVLLLRGCVQPVFTPRSNAAAARVLDRLGFSAVEAGGSGCCGAVSQHLAAGAEAKGFIRRNLDAWRPHLDAGAEAIVSCSSGCGAMLKDYAHLMRDDPEYAELAQRASALTRDLSEILEAEDLSPLGAPPPGRTAVHCPCTLTHALKKDQALRKVLARAGVEFAETREDHLCCGSAGTYSLLQPELSRRLLERKLAALGGDDPERIVTANVGCQLHLASATGLRVAHWIELFDEISNT